METTPTIKLDKSQAPLCCEYQQPSEPHQLTDHHPAGLLAEVAPVAVDERLLQLRGRDLPRLVLVDGVEPLLHVGVHLRSGRGTVAAGRGAAGIASGRGAPRWGTGATITLEFEN